MAVIQSEFSCPTCKSQTGKLNRILANAGELVCSGNAAHKWNDTDSFYALGPTMDFEPIVYKGLPQVDHTPISVSIPIALKAKVEKRFGTKLSATVAGILELMLEETITVSQTDLVRISEKLGKRPANGAELYGLIYSKLADSETATQERDMAVQNLKAYEGFSPGRIVVSLGPHMATVAEKARDAGLPMAIWVERQLDNALSSNWF